MSEKNTKKNYELQHKSFKHQDHCDLEYSVWAANFSLNKENGHRNCKLHFQSQSPPYTQHM